MARATSRTQPCSPEQALVRLRHAEKFIEVARIVCDEETDAEYTSASAALAVLAGIAASDAACCKALGRRSRGQDHQSATELLEQIVPGGKQAARDLRRLLSIKDTAHYGLVDLSGTNLRSALKQAESLVEFAARIVRGA